MHLLLPLPCYGAKFTAQQQAWQRWPLSMPSLLGECLVPVLLYVLGGTIQWFGVQLCGHAVCGLGLQATSLIVIQEGVY